MAQTIRPSLSLWSAHLSPVHGRRADGGLSLHHDLNRVVSRVALIFRILWAGSAVATMIAWTALAGWQLPPAAVAVAALVWVAVMAWVHRSRHEFPGWVAVADGVIFAFMLAAQGALVPIDLVGDGTTWVWNGACISILIACWLLKPVDAVGVVVALVAAALIGVAAAGRPATAFGTLMTSGIMAFQLAIGTVTILAIRLAVTRADSAVTRTIAVEKAQAAQVAEQALREEHDASLHDNVKNNLFLLGAGHLDRHPELVRARASEAVASLEQLVNGARSLEHRTLLAELGRLVNTNSDVGLHVLLDIDQEMSKERDVSRWLPWEVVDAVCGATAQALANVHAHAGVTAATLRVTSRPGRITVVVSDQGKGFNTGETDRSGEGIPNSIIGRMRRVGGTANLISRPIATHPDHHGTTWTMTWDGAVAPQPLQPLKIAQEAIREHGRGFILMFVILAAIFHTLSLYPLVSGSSSGDYHSWELAWACWAAIGLSGLTLAVGVFRSSISITTARLVGALIVVASVTLVADCRPAAILGWANWALPDSIWILTVLAIYTKLRDALIAGAINAASAFLIVAAVIDPDTPNFVKFAGIIASTLIIQTGAAAAVAFMKRATATTSDALWKAGAIAAASQAQQAADSYGRRLYAEIDVNIIQLLHGISSGAIDPANPDVARRCRDATGLLKQAATLRRAGAHELAALLTAAAGRAITLDLVVRGHLDHLAPELRQATAAALQRLLSNASPGMASLAIQSRTASATPEDPSSSLTETSVSMQVTIPAGSGPDLRHALMADPPKTRIGIDLRLYDDDGNPGDLEATLALMKVVLPQ